MKRLTLRNGDGSVSQPLDLKWDEALERLADYEDTGLTPEAVHGLCEMDRRSRMSQMIRWEKAEAEGRLIVLPCKVGDTMYRICREYRTGSPFIRAVTFNRNNFWRIVFGGEYGKTVFLSREEAEAALRKEQGE